MKKIIVSITFLFLLFEVLYFQSNLDTVRYSKVENDEIYILDGSETVKDEIRSIYHSHILNQDQLTILCNQDTMNEIQNKYDVVVRR